MAFKQLYGLIFRHKRNGDRWRVEGNRVYIDGDCIISGPNVYISGKLVPDLDGIWLQRQRLVVSGDLSTGKPPLA